MAMLWVKDDFGVPGTIPPGLRRGGGRALAGRQGFAKPAPVIPDPVRPVRRPFAVGRDMIEKILRRHPFGKGARGAAEIVTKR